ncbi:hypothetical protein MMC32_006162, partial [Xylographa parallela]|nr:hypothetical protein [Xylographa parallela]
MQLLDALALLALVAAPLATAQNNLYTDNDIYARDVVYARDAGREAFYADLARRTSPGRMPKASKRGDCHHNARIQYYCTHKGTAD